jgi:hypothetical protein
MRPQALLRPGLLPVRRFVLDRAHDAPEDCRVESAVRPSFIYQDGRPDPIRQQGFVHP